MSVWRVEQIRWDYEQTSWSTEAIFDNQADALAFVEASKLTHGFTSESSPGSDYEWVIEQHPVWTGPVAPVVVWHCSTGLQPDGTPSFAFRAYRVESCYPVGYIVPTTKDLAPVGDEGWSRLTVSAGSEEALHEAFAELLARWQRHCSGAEPLLPAPTQEIAERSDEGTEK